ncbi:MAG: tetratricopeptide repeat protein [Sphingomicrobium sp.]
MRPWNSNNAVPAVLVTAGRNDSASQALTRDFAVQLGSQSSLQSGALRLITSPPSASDKPTLILEISGLAEPQSRGASLLLKTDGGDAVVWSRDFREGQRSRADMNLQMALTAARVLGCAAGALGNNGGRLASRTRNLYLAACGQTAEGGNYDPGPVIDELSKVVAAAPAFAPAWRKLLLAEADAIDSRDEPEAGGAAARALREHIAAARRIEPQMAEARVAEITLVPRHQLVSRMRLIDEAYRSSPYDPAVLIRRTRLLQDVGRMSEGVPMAYRASTIDPASAAALDNYISALLNNGQIDLAEQQLKRAQLLWPGTSTLDELEFRFYLRFGDPKVGLKMASDRMVSPTLMLFIEARANPTKADVDKLFAYYATHLNRNRSDLPALDILVQAYGQFHRENELYDIMLHWPDQAEFATMEDVWFRPALHQFRRDPRFMQVAAHSPLLRYWRTTGDWPDFCKEPDLPYDCQKEAAKYAV